MRLKTKNKIPSITNLATTSGLKAKVNDIKNKIPNHTNLSATIDLPTVENNISKVSKKTRKVVKKTDSNTKVS